MIPRTIKEPGTNPAQANHPTNARGVSAAAIGNTHITSSVIPKPTSHTPSTRTASNLPRRTTPAQRPAMILIRN